MSEEWRIWLYLLGLIPQALFGARFLVQWLVSEQHRKSIVPRLFWKFSLVGNILMLAHATLQLQYHVAVIQVTNGVIAWRNLDLMGRRRATTAITVVLLLFATATVTWLFFWLAPGGFSSWFRVPQMPWQTSAESVSWQWHLFGTLALIFFSTRFWVQWWQAEYEQKSRLSPLFWWITYVGNIMLFVYFWKINDPINWLGPLLMAIPACRNLLLLRRSQLQPMQH